MSDAGHGDFEFERKFVLRELPDAALAEPEPAFIVQSYFLAADGYALRIRLQGPPPARDLPADCDEREMLEAAADTFTFCALTAKGPYVGGTRYEAERELDVAAGLAMVRLGGDLVVKRRYSLWIGSDGWVIDSFLGRNHPLVIAECERGGPVVDLEIPSFCVSEVSDDPRFSNDSLAVDPYRHWSARYERELHARGPRFLTDFGQNRLGLSI